MSKAEIFAKDLIQQYQNLADRLYYNLLKSNPDALMLYHTSNIAIYYVLLDENYFLSDSQQIVYVYKVGANLTFEEIDLTSSSYYDYTGEPYFDKKITDILIESKTIESVKDIIENVSADSRFLNDIINDKNEYTLLSSTNKYYDALSRNLLNRHAGAYHSHVNHPQEHYAKNAARYAYSELDLNPIIDKVNDEDFEYQMDQAIAAYDASLYLASCATLGVCLETCCKLLLIKNNVKIKDSDATMLDESVKYFV